MVLCSCVDAFCVSMIFFVCVCWCVLVLLCVHDLCPCFFCFVVVVAVCSRFVCVVVCGLICVGFCVLCVFLCVSMILARVSCLACVPGMIVCLRIQILVVRCSCFSCVYVPGMCVICVRTCFHVCVPDFSRVSMDYESIISICMVCLCTCVQKCTAGCRGSSSHHFRQAWSGFFFPLRRVRSPAFLWLRRTICKGALLCCTALFVVADCTWPSRTPTFALSDTIHRGT